MRQSVQRKVDRLKQTQTIWMINHFGDILNWITGWSKGSLHGYRFLMSNWQTDLAEDLKWQPIMLSHERSSVQLQRSAECSRQTLHNHGLGLSSRSTTLEASMSTAIHKNKAWALIPSLVYTLHINLVDLKSESYVKSRKIHKVGQIIWISWK